MVSLVDIVSFRNPGFLKNGLCYFFYFSYLSESVYSLSASFRGHLARFFMPTSFEASEMPAKAQDSER